MVSLASVAWGLCSGPARWSSIYLYTLRFLLSCGKAFLIFLVDVLVVLKPLFHVH
ncbi:hypothetical protein BDV40DRAFT_8050 [Aspergillus tamarii]|uniref:Uncharacterized protein n=1 Tax=Aspergillus tamarii TaxID=41984 RepID=A0A5N6UL63_ASPTM|nr:hypothetical protein BDV40DRAFT_8050 [Aspergillus tamarii]